MKKGEIVSKAEQEELEAEAQEHDLKLTTALAHLDKSLFAVACEVEFIRSKHLYRYIKNPETDGDNRGCFGDWTEYARVKLGNMSSARMYELLSAKTLACGINAVQPEEIEELGIKKSAQLARLPEKKRTPQLIQQAKHQSVKEVTKHVNRMLDEEKPEAERKEKLVALNIGLPQVTIDLINEVERDGMFLDAIRDGDKTLSLRAKLWHAVFWFFKDSHREELEQASERREAFIAQQKAQNESPIAQV